MSSVFPDPRRAVLRGETRGLLSSLRGLMRLLPAGVAVAIVVASLFGTGVSLSTGPGAVAAQTGACGTIIQVDQPAAGAVVTGPLTITGWAIDSSATVDTGVTAVQVYADAPRDKGGTLIGDATYGLARPDLGANLGANFEAAAFELKWDPGTQTGPRTLYVYAQTACGWQAAEVAVDVRPVTCQPQMTLEFPAANAKIPNAGEVTLVGWALDPYAKDGTGVTNIAAYQGNDTRGKQLATARSGLGRIDVAAALNVSGTAMLSSGWAIYLDPRALTPDSGSGNLGKTTLTVGGSTNCGTISRTITLELVDSADEAVRDFQQLLPPRNLRLMKWENGNALLAWDPSPSRGVLSYEVQMSRLGAGFQTKTSVGGDVTTAEITGLNQNERFDFKVFATRGDLKSRATNEVTTALPPNPTSAVQATATPQALNAQGQAVAPTPAPNTGGGFFGLPGAGSGASSSSSSSSNSSSAGSSGSACVPGGSSSLQVTVIPAGSSGSSIPGAVGSLPTPMIQQAVQTNPAFRTVTVTFAPVSGATGYQLLRSTNQSGGFQVVGQSLGTQTQIQDSNIPTSGTYYYQVVAVGVNNQRSQPSQAYPVTVR